MIAIIDIECAVIGGSDNVDEGGLDKLAALLGHRVTGMLAGLVDGHPG